MMLVLSLLVSLTSLFAYAELNFDGAEATSTQIHQNDSVFDAYNALTNGVDFWASAAQDSQATWTAWFNTPTMLSGLLVSWENAPASYSVFTSLDRKKFFKVYSEQVHHDGHNKFDENIKFDEPLFVSVIRIAMNNEHQNYIGIRQVLPIPVSDSPFMLVNGTTDHDVQELCLSIENGQKRHGQKVVAEPCISALANSDFREMFLFTSENKLKSAFSDDLCVAYNKTNSTFYLEDCSSYTSIPFEYQYTGELQNGLQRQVAECMIVEGELISKKIEKLKELAVVTASSILDSAHSQSLVVDGDPDTFYASQPFDDATTHEVKLTLEFENPLEFSQVNIDWEYPALSFSVGVSDNGTSYKILDSVHFNGLHATNHLTGKRKTSFIQIIMTIPHPEFGLVDNKFVYGIKNVELYNEMYSLVMQECVKGRVSTTAGQRWFRYFVRNNDIKLVNDAISAKDQIIVTTSDFIKSITSSTSNNYGQCASRSDKLVVEVKELKDKVRSNMVIHSTPRQAIQRSDSGLNKLQSRASCPDDSEGFYFISNSFFENQIVRLYCYKGVGYMLVELDSGTRFKNPMKICSAHNLSPIMYNDETLLSKIDYLQTSMYNKSRPVIIGIDLDCYQTQNCAKKFTDPAGLHRIENFFLAEVLMARSTSDVIFYMNSEVAASKLMSSDKSFLVPCEYRSYETAGKIVKFSCDDSGNATVFQTLAKNAIMKAYCPDYCDNKPVYGDFYYSSDSNICTAVKHSGVKTDSSRVFGISVYSALNVYNKAERNGITSHISSKQGLYSLNFVSLVGESKILSSLNEIVPETDDIDPNSVVNKAKTDKKSSSSGSGDLVNNELSVEKRQSLSLVKYTPENINSASQKALTALLKLQDTVYNIDKSSVQHLRISLLRVLVNTMSQVKVISGKLTTIGNLAAEIDILSRVTDDFRTRASSLSQQKTVVQQNHQAVNTKMKNIRLSEDFMLRTKLQPPFYLVNNKNININVYETPKRLNIANTVNNALFDDVFPNSDLISDSILYDFKFTFTISVITTSMNFAVLYHYNDMYKTGFGLRIAGVADNSDDTGGSNKSAYEIIVTPFVLIKGVVQEKRHKSRKLSLNLSSEFNPIQIKVQKGHHVITFAAGDSIQFYDESYTVGSLALAVGDVEAGSSAIIKSLQLERLECITESVKSRQLYPALCSLAVSRKYNLMDLREVVPSQTLIVLTNDNTFRLRTLGETRKQHIHELQYNGVSFCVKGIISFNYRLYNKYNTIADRLDNSFVNEDSVIGIKFSDFDDREFFIVWLKHNGLYVSYNSHKLQLVDSRIRLDLNDVNWSEFTLHVDFTDQKYSLNNSPFFKQPFIKSNMSKFTIVYSNVKDLYLSNIKVVPTNLSHLYGFLY